MATDKVLIDGSEGEGGGQILRTSLALSCITGRRLQIENIRAARPKPGLARQHLSCVHAACRISGGRCKGDALGSKVLDFQPGPVRGGDFHFEIDSAGSASLVVQTVMAALFLAEKPSRITVTGGTHNPWAPPFDFISETFLPAISTAGFKGNCKLIRPGFYPAGGGEMIFSIEPRLHDTPGLIDLCRPPEQVEIRARIYTSKLPARVAIRQEKLLLKGPLAFDEIEHIDVENSPGPGNCIVVRLSSDRRTTVFTAFGRRRKPSEKVVGEVLALAGEFLAGRAAVDRYLADQLLIYMAILRNGAFTTNKLSRHLTTNIDVIGQFLPAKFTIDRREQPYGVSCRGV